jgi:hypothetical protein
MRQHFLTVLVTLILSGNLVAQNTDKQKIVSLFKATQKKFEEAKNYSMKSEFKLFVSATSQEIKEQYTGFVVKIGDDSYTNLANTEMVKVGSYYVKIDNPNKRIKVTKDTKKSTNLVDLVSYLDYYSGFKVTENKIASETICELTTSKIALVPYSKVRVFFSKVNQQLLRQEMFFLSSYKTKVVAGKPVYDYPRLEINYTDFKTTGVDAQNYLNLSQYITLTKNGFVPAKKYKNYSIVD